MHARKSDMSSIRLTLYYAHGTCPVVDYDIVFYTNI